jgi:hypothetical protein
MLRGSATELTQLSLSNPDDRPALGPLTDYRVELQLALNRSLEMTEFGDGIFIGSLLDNMAHEYIRYELFKRTEIEDEAMEVRHYLTSALLYAILIDSFSADIVAYLPPEEPLTDEYEQKVDEFYSDIFDFFSIDTLTLSKDKTQSLKLLINEVKRLQKEANGQRNDNQESSEEESE